MNKEEAIKHLSEWMDEKMWRCFGTIDREAIGMAIEALQFAEHFNLLKEHESLQEVVRCKDCKHWQKTNIETIDGEPIYDCPFCGEWADANGFCSFGERREE